MGYTAQAAIKAASGQVGYRESGTNNTKFNHWLGRISGYPHDGFGYAWCCSFQGWTADQGGGEANVDYPRTAGCAVAVAWFKSRGRWATSPHVGDWVFYGPHGSTHVELVVAVHSTSIVTIGGNTSGSLEGRYFAGDGVYRKSVSRNSTRIYGYGRPKYEEDDVSAKDVWGYNIKAPWVEKGGDDQWQADTHIRVMHSHIRAIEAQLAAQAVTLDKLVDAVAAGPGVDVEALKTEIREAIESVKVRLDATP